MIGFFGGSFDPVHFGHLDNARAMKRLLDLSELYLMPCAKPVHKSELSFSNQARIEMLQLAIQDYDELKIDLREINRESASYTITSLIEIKQQYPTTPICLIMGMDSYVNLPSWKDYQEFAQYTHLVILNRPEFTNNQIEFDLFTETQNINDLHQQACGLVYFANTPMLDISSSMIRGKISSQSDLTGLMPDTLIHYINHHGINQTT